MEWPMIYRGLSGTVLGAAIGRHNSLGPGVLESIYEHALALEPNVKRVLYQWQIHSANKS